MNGWAQILFVEVDFMKRVFLIALLILIVLPEFVAGEVAGASGIAGQTEAAVVAPEIDFGNTAWVLMASALVMFMTMPALGLFYGGLVKRKNVLSVLMQCFITLSVVSIIWVTVGYSLAFGPGKGAPAPYIGSCPRPL
jgi:Amt family ammonium transporter